MFGYILPYKPELKIKDYDYYKSIYCGLCHNLKHIGNIPRMFLNYDFVFLYLVLKEHFALKDEFERKSCIAHPFKKRVILKSNEILEFVSKQMLILTYFKLYDDFIDNKDLIKGMLKTFLSIYLRRYKTQYNSSYHMIKSLIKKQIKLEKENCSNLDLLAHNFGEILSIIFGYNNDVILKKIGYYTGIWIYIVDAIDDYIEDIKKKRYNCLKYQLQKVESKQAFEDQLYILEVTSNNYLSQLNDLIKPYNNTLLENIVQVGMYAKTAEVINKLKAKYEELISK